MKVLTLNTWQKMGPWRDRWELIFQGLKVYDPDLVAFQEVFDPEWVQVIRERSGFPFYYFPQPDSGLLSLSRYPIQPLQAFQYPTQSPTETYRRYLTLLRVNAGGRDIVFLNTHLSWLPEEARVREGQVSDLLSILKQSAEEAECIAAGDFNAAPAAPEICRLINPGGFVDIFKASQPQSEAVTWDHRNPFAAGARHHLPDRRIDYIFYKGSRLTSVPFRCELVYDRPEKELFASDHYGVLAHFSFTAIPA